MLTYIKLFVDYLDCIEELKDAERGRLFTALLEYARTGEAPRLSGNERYVFPMMRAQMDRDAAAYQEIVEKHRENGKKGGRPKKQKNQEVFAETEKTKDKDKDEDKDKDKDKDEDKDEDKMTAATARGREEDRVMSAYREKINAFPSRTSMDQLRGYAGTLGEAVCLRAIDLALDAGPDKANWRYLHAILRAWQEKGVRCLDDIERLDKKPEPKRGPPPDKRRACSDYTAPETLGGMRRDIQELERLTDLLGKTQDLLK